MVKPVKLLFVVTEDWYFFSHRLPIALAAKHAGFEVVVATRVKNHKKIIEENGIRVVGLKCMKRSSLNVFRELAAFIELFFIFRNERPKLLHLVALKPVIYGSVVANLFLTPARVCALGGLGFIFSSNKIFARVLRPIILRVFRYIFNYPFSKLILQNQDDLIKITKEAGVDMSRVCLIKSAGVDLDEYKVKDLPQGIPVIMLASRMLWDKGVGEFVEAARAVNEKGIQARFVLVGDPDLENPSSISKKQLQAWNDSGVIEWWGYSANMPEMLSRANIVCLPTYYGEGVPKVLIEAMACARPIVTTDMPGCRDLVSSGKNGILIRPKDSNGLANALMTLLTNKEKCKKMGIEGRKIAEEYSILRVVHETVAIYKELCPSLKA